MMSFFLQNINNKFGISNDALIPYLFSYLCSRLNFSGSILSATPKYRKRKLQSWLISRLTTRTANQGTSFS